MDIRLHSKYDVKSNLNLVLPVEIIKKKMEIYDQCKAEIRELFRLGKKDNQSEDKIRPLKVRMLTSTSVTAILGAAKKLKNLEDYKIYGNIWAFYRRASSNIMSKVYEKYWNTYSS